MKNRKKQINKEKYMEVLWALKYLADIEEENDRRELAKRKAKKVLGWITFIGAFILVSLNFITTPSFDFSWMAKLEKWYSDFYVSLVAYIIITVVVMALEKYCKMDQKPAFGYIWPFIGFLLTLLLTNTMSARIVEGEPRVIFSTFFFCLIPSYLLMKSAFDVGKNKAKNNIKRIKEIEQVITENPDVVETIKSDCEKRIKESVNNNSLK